MAFVATPSGRLLVGVQGDVTVLQLPHSEFWEDIAVERTGAEMLEVVDGGTRKIVVVLENITFMSTRGLGKFLTLQSRLAEQGGKIVLCSIPEVFWRPFERKKVEKLFLIAPDLLTALKLLAEHRTQQ